MAKPYSRLPLNPKHSLIALVLLSLAFSAGCVDINDTRVQVQRPGDVDIYQRNVLDRCPSHKYPHRLVVAQTGLNSPLAQRGSQIVTTQTDFDQLWAALATVENSNITTTSLTQEPVVNWEQEQALFMVVAVDNSCQKTLPFGDEMTTDCYSITAPLFRYWDGSHCGPPIYYPVFLYIYPKTGWPVNIQWVVPTPTFTMTPKPIPTATPRATPTPEPESEDE